MSRLSPDRAAFGAATHPYKRGGGRRGATLHPYGRFVDEPPDSPLLAEALAKTRAKLAEKRNDGNRVAVLRKPGSGALFTWDAGVRVDICAGEATCCLRSDGDKLYHAVPTIAASGAMSGTSVKLLTISGLPLAPAATMDVLRAQALRVQRAAIERSDRTAEILSQADDPWPFFAASTNLKLHLTPRTAELIEVGLRLLSCVVMHYKHRLAIARPVDVSVHVGPMIETPGHGSTPSGHAAVAFFLATLMPMLMNEVAAGAQIGPQLERLAFRITYNRVVAGVHYPMDGLAGRLVGRVLAHYFAGLCEPGRPILAHGSFDGTRLDATNAAEPGSGLPAEARGWPPLPPIPGLFDDGTTAPNPAPSTVPALRQLWTAATAELQQQQLRG